MGGSLIDPDQIRQILQAVAEGSTPPEEALGGLSALQFEDVGYALLDHPRGTRTGFPEVVLAEGKTPEQVAEIARRVYEKSGLVLTTRADQAARDAVCAIIPEAHRNDLGRLVWADRRESVEYAPGAVVVTAGTADLPVAEEAAVTARLVGAEVTRVNDVGVAGLHRVLSVLPKLREARAIVVVAGMEGALPSVVAGLVQAPVIAAPTSTGYGASLGGVAALLGMLNSCATGVAVVNIDNGFGAGYMAATIARAAAGM